MASRSDQLHSQQFTLQRVVGALAMRDADPAASPSRRIGGSLVASVLVAALAVAAVGVYGVLRPGGSTSWQAGNAVIVEEETGARFVYRDGVLHPVLNYSSAVLVLGQPSPPRVRVSRSSLSGVPRGQVLGIAGAPDALPAAADLLAGAWTLCSRPVVTQPGAAGPQSVLLVGSTVQGRPLDDAGVLAVDVAGGLHLLWHARRYAIAAPELVLAAFAWSRSAAVPVSAALLNAVPAGPDLGPVAVPRGTPAVSPVDGLRLGQVFVVETATGDKRFGVVLANGLADVTAAQADLLLADPAGPGGRPTPIGQAQYAAAPKSPTALVPTGDGAPPASPPTLAPVDSQTGVCASFPSSAAPTLTLAPASPVAGEQRTRPGPADLTAPVDVVAVPPGRGALVSSAGVLSLVVDLGLRFPVPSTDVARLLGYAGVAPLTLPPSLVSLLPSGHPLDPASALLPASAT
jgi:type VII secretion protein EccB